MTPKQRGWATRLKNLLDNMPAGIEILVGDGHIDIHPAGFYMDEIWHGEADMMKAGDLIEEASLKRIEFDATRIRPNSETI